MDSKELAHEIFKVSHLTGSFLLRSGQISNEYFDKYQFEAYPKLLRPIAEQLAQLIPNTVEMYAALEMGGIPIATALALHTNIPMTFVRKSAKEYGTCKLAEGPDLRGRKVCVIEDVITTGGQVVTSTKQLRELGAIIEYVACVIYRGPGQIAPAISEIGLKQLNLFTRDQLVPTK